MSPDRTWLSCRGVSSRFGTTAPLPIGSPHADFYSDSLYTARDDDPSKPRKPLMLGPFRIDVYEYPPPFLLLPRALMRVAPNFHDFRALWFGLSGLFLLAVMLWIPRFFAPSVATRAVLWLPVFWAAMSTMSVIQ